MPQLTVTFLQIEVHDDADNFPNGAGEIYYDFQIGTTSVVSRTRDNPHVVDSGQNILINHTRTAARPDNDPAAFLRIAGAVSEQDSGLSFGDDHAGSFENIHSPADNWGVGTHQARLRGDGLDVTVHYSISIPQVDPVL